MPSTEPARLGGLEIWAIGTQGEVEAAQRILSSEFTVVTRSETDDRLTGNDWGRIRRYLRLRLRTTSTAPTPPPESEDSLV